MVHLGFEIGTGGPVEVPVGHMVVSGQSQLSGKTANVVKTRKTVSEPAWWYISFCDPGKPAGDKFLGACVVSAPRTPGDPRAEMVAVTGAAHAAHCNPGGEAVAIELPSWFSPRPADVNRLLSAEEAKLLTPQPAGSA